MPPDPTSTTSTGKDETNTSQESTGDNNTTTTSNESTTPTDKDGGTAITEPSGDQDKSNSEGKKPTEGAGEIEIKPPEGMEVDKEGLAKFVGVAKDAGLNSEQANKVFKHYVELHEAQVSAVIEQDKTWDKQLREDKEFGGENYETNSQITRMVVLELGGQPLADLINEHNLGNNPVLAKAFWNARELFKETIARSKGAPSAGSSTEEQQLRRDYPSMFNEDGTPK